MYVQKLESSIFRKIERDKILVFNMNTGEETVYNETGRVFLDVLDGSVQSVDKLLQTIALEYDGLTVEDLRPDYIEFLRDLQNKGIVKIGDKIPDVEEYHLEDIHIEITMKCNERCIHCYIPNCIKDEGMDMPFDAFCVIVDDAVKLGCKTISISGGEPLLHKDFMSILEYCKKKDLTVNLFSNLVLLRDEHIDILKSMKVGMIQVSVYSVIPEEHDEVTQIKGSLAKTLLSIKKLRKEGFDVSIACPVMQANHEHVKLLMQYAKENKIGLRLNSLLTAQSDGNTESVKICRLSIEQSEKMLCSLMNCDGHYTYENILEIKPLEADLYSLPNKFLNRHICSAGINYCCISPNGNVYPCPDWERYTLGNIYKQSLFDIWYYSKNLKRLRQLNKQKSMPECLECEALSYCKRCFVQNELENYGDILRFNERTCNEAFLRMQIVEDYKKKGILDDD